LMRQAAVDGGELQAAPKLAGRGAPLDKM